jgi:hypothetical protein
VRSGAISSTDRTRLQAPFRAGIEIEDHKLDLAWATGLQERLIAPVAILIDEGQEAEAVANRAGFRFFTSVEAFKIDARRDVLALEPTGV